MAKKKAEQRTRVTLQDIADQAKVSKATVSLALRHHPSISVSMQKKIADLAEQLDYRPNPFVSAHMAALRSSRKVELRANIAYLISHDRAFNLDSLHRFQEAYYEGAKEEASNLGYGLSLFSLLEYQDSYERLERVLTKRGIAGVIISHMNRLPRRIDFNWTPFANCALGDSLIDPRLHRVQTNNVENLNQIVQRLSGQGYRRFGFVCEPTPRLNDRGQTRGAFLNFQETQEPSDRIPVLYTDHLENDGFLEWINKHRPEVLITTRAKWVFDVLKRRGFKVPQDISLATIFGTTEDRECRITGNYVDYRVMGAAAVDVVVEQIHRNERGYPRNQRTTMIPAGWWDGDTLRVPV